jgi:beta-N-acetylhexosaminidase
MSNIYLKNNSDSLNDIKLKILNSKRGYYSREYSEEEIIGQSLIVSIVGTHFNSQTETFLDEVKPGGVILMPSNIESRTQVRRLTKDLQKWALSRNLPPLFICIDQEGGVVQRLTFAPVEYSQPALGAIDKKSVTQQNTQKLSEELADLGINVNFAPVVDVAYSSNSIMADRSFGNNPELVEKHLLWETAIYDKNPRVLYTLKHFPGHGRTPIDSHETIPSITVSLGRWYDTDGKPFEAGIERGARIVMTGHIKYPKVDDKIASQSGFWINEVLRKELGFKGLVIADDIKMGAVEDNYIDAGAKFLDAGNDMIITILEPEKNIQLEQSLYNHQKKLKANNVKRTKKVYWRFLRILAVKDDMK